MSDPWGSSDPDRELLPYVAQSKNRERRRRAFLTPVEKLLDLLQRGQYVSANIADELLDRRDDPNDRIQIGKAIKEGITGEVKGSYSDVLKEHFDWANNRIFGGERGPTWGGVLGFFGDVFLDPTTYMGVGSAKAGATAVRNFADDSLKLFRIKAMVEPETIKKMFNLSDDALKKITDDATEIARKNLRNREGLGGIASRYNDDIVKRAQARARNTSGDELAGEMSSEAQRLLDRQWATGTQYSDDTSGFLQDLADNAKDRYAGAGAKSFRALRKEIPLTGRAESALQGIGKVAESIKTSTPIRSFQRAVDVVAGPGTKIGKARDYFRERLEAVGVRGAYSRHLRDIELSKVVSESALTKEKLDGVRSAIGDLDEEAKQGIVKTLSRAQSKVGITSDGIVDHAMVRAEFGEKAPEVLRGIEKIRELTDGWMDFIRKAQDELGMENDIGEIENYLPIIHRGRGMRNFRKKRKMTPLETRDIEKEKLSFLLGVDDKTAEGMIDSGWGSLITDLDQMLGLRAMAQAKYERKVELIKEMRAFGFDTRLARDDLGVQAFDTHRKDMPTAGLAEISHPALEGYLFDEDVAHVIERATKITDSDKGLAGFLRGIGQINNYYRGFLTLSPGFHFRNIFNNEFQGIMNYGAEWVSNTFDSTLATVYALKGDDAARKWFSKLAKGTKHGTYDNWMAKKFNGKTLRELADDARKRGVITEMTRTSDYVQLAEDRVRSEFAKGWEKVSRAGNPMSSHFKPIEINREIGATVESIPRFKSYLLEHKRGPGGEDGLFNAAIEAKKIFFDYEDLTEFERKFMKNTILFYTWTRKNLSRQIYQMAHNVEMYQFIPKLEDLLSQEDVNIPEWMRDQHELILKTDLADTLKELPVMDKVFEGSNGLAWWSNLAYQDLNTLPFRFMGDSLIPRFAEFDDAKDEILQRANPLIKSILEISTDRDVFYDSPLGERRSVRGTGLFGDGLWQMLDGALKYIGHPDGLEPRIDEQGNIELPSKIGVLLEENLPMLKQFDRMMDLPELLIPALDKARDNSEGDIDKKLRALSFYLGIKFNDYDPREAAQRVQEDILREAEEERYQDMRNRPGYQSRSADYWRDRNNRSRRLVGRL